MSSMARAITLQRAKILNYVSNLVSHDNERALRGLKVWRSVATFGKATAALIHMVDEIEKWLVFDVDHESVSETVSEVLSSANIHNLFGVQDALAMRRFLGTIGLFSAAEPLLLRSAHASLLPPRQNPSRRDVHRCTRAVILTGNSDRAAELIKVLKRLPQHQTTKTLLSYLLLWLNGEVTQTTAFLIGPAPLTLRSYDYPTLNVSGKVIRVLMPGVPVWGDANDPLKGRTNVVYANGQTTEWLTDLPSDERELLVSHFDEVIVNHHEQWISEEDNVRVAPPISPLFFSGSPNMASIIVVDQLLGSDQHLFVDGVTFFLGKTPYRNDQRRQFRNQTTVSDATGSTGRPFERCRAIASHDQTNNRALLRNLLQSGMVSGSREFTHALKIDDHAYCVELDQTYGKQRI